MKRNFDRETYAELRDLYTHYQRIFPDVKNRAKPLIRWYIKSLATEIDRRGRERDGSSAELLRQKAAERGTMLHRLLESRSRGEEMECPPDVAPFWKEARKILGTIGPVSASEKPLYHPRRSNRSIDFCVTPDSKSD